MTDFERKVNRDVLRYAVQRAITCPTCGCILDVKKAVATFSNKRAGVTCVTCFEEVLADLMKRHDWTREQILEGIDVHDGRELFGRAA